MRGRRGPPGIQVQGADATDVLGPAFVTRCALAAAAFVIALAFLAQGRPVLAGAWAATQAGGGLLNLLLNGMVERARPEPSGLFVSA